MLNSRHKILMLSIVLLILSSCGHKKKSFWESGKLKSELSFKNGKLNGPASWYYEDGIKEQEANYADNLLDGLMKRWYNTGVLESELSYKDGKLNGTSITYDEYGHKVDEENYRNDTLDGPYYQWYANSKLRIEGAYKNGFFTGTWLYYNESGNVVGNGNFIGGTGIQKAWWPNGKLKRETHYQENLKHGEEKRFDENGKLHEVIRFNKGVRVKNGRSGNH